MGFQSPKPKQVATGEGFALAGCFGSAWVSLKYSAGERPQSRPPGFPGEPDPAGRGWLAFVGESGTIGAEQG